MSSVITQVKNFFRAMNRWIRKYFWQELSTSHIPENVEHRLAVTETNVQQHFFVYYENQLKQLRNKRYFYLSLIVIGVLMRAWVLTVVGIFLLASAKTRLKKVAEQSLARAINAAGKPPKNSSWQHLAASLHENTDQSLPSKRIPQNLTVPYDSTNPSLESLQKGFLLDYDLKTWEVVHHAQFEWENGTIDTVFKIVSSSETQQLYLRRESGFTQVFVASPISIFLIDESIEQQINNMKKPSNTVTYQQTTYYRENSKNGYWFDMTTTNHYNVATLWEYMDETRKRILRIEQIGQRALVALIGKLVSAYHFSDILPKPL